MSDVEVEVIDEVEVAAPPAKKKRIARKPKTPTKKSGPPIPAKPKKTAKRWVPTHPPISEMVSDALLELNERSGSSFRAIKKFIAEKYKVDVNTIKETSLLKRFLIAAVGSGKLIRLNATKGGASGSFKLVPPGKIKKPAAAAPAGAQVEKQPAAATRTNKKTAARKAPVKKSSPVKAKAKTPPKPKPRKAEAAKKSAPKKTKK